MSFKDFEAVIEMSKLRGITLHWKAAARWVR
jgi:hypothetical protein